MVAFPSHARAKKLSEGSTHHFQPPHFFFKSFFFFFCRGDHPARTILLFRQRNSPQWLSALSTVWPGENVKSYVSHQFTVLGYLNKKMQVHLKTALLL